MAIVAVIMQKGGVGKTTIATNLAGTAAASGAKVRLYDANPGQSSAYQWSRLSAPQARLTAVRVENDFRQEVLADAENFDHIVIDTPPNLDTETRCAMSLADVIVVPLRIGQYDIWTLSQTAKVITDLRALGGKFRAIAFVNAVPHYIKAELDDALATIEEMKDAFELGPTLIDRGGFRRSARLGLSVTELPKDYRDAKAVDEFEKLYTEVFRG